MGVKCRRYAHIYDAKVHDETEFPATFVGPQGPFCGICAAQYVNGDFICILARYTMPCVPRRTSQIGVCHAECMNGYVFVDSEDDPEEDLMDSDWSGFPSWIDGASRVRACSSRGSFSRVQAICMDPDVQIDIVFVAVFVEYMFTVGLVERHVLRVLIWPPVRPLAGACDQVQAFLSTSSVR